MVTAHHVIEDVERARVTLRDGRMFGEIEVLADDHEHDLAILRTVEPLADAPILEFSPAEQVMVGQPVYAIGNPGRFDYSLSAGIVGGLRKIHGTNLIQSQAPVGFGSSGGPVLDEHSPRPSRSRRLACSRLCPSRTAHASRDPRPCFGGSWE